MSAERPCARDCGLFVPLDGPRVCAVCEAGDAIRDAARAEGAERRRKEDALLDHTETKCGPYTVRTSGFSVYLDDNGFGSPMPRGEARSLAAALIRAAEHVETLTTPYADGRPWPEEEKT
jgi:hypothetical protein